MSERDHSHATSHADATPSRDEAEPGRSSKSALMRKPDHAIASGLVQRKARDANGVAEGAEHAVAAASSSSGSALPDTLMRKFESSLGADLSGVRVHTGDASAAANDAVGAKAYTVGNDIHFGAGHYDPSSEGGQHLLAHEVAHTVQQSGMAQRMQFKLAVSSPGDALEHEADRAADAMVRGAPASVSTGSGIQRKPQGKVVELPPIVMGADKETAVGEATPALGYNGTAKIAPCSYVHGAGEGPEAITSPWTSNPAFTAALPMAGSGETFDTVYAARQSFRSVWTLVQTGWNRAVPIARRFMNAQADAEAKGLADFGKQAGSLDQSAEELHFSTKTKVFDAFDGKGNLTAKPATFTGASGELKQSIASAKKAIADADTAIEVQSTEIEGAVLELDTAGQHLTQASSDYAKAEADANIAPLERQGDAYKKSAALIDSVIDTLGAFGSEKGKLTGVGGAVGGTAKIINTLFWDEKLDAIQSQIDVFQGAKAGADMASAQAGVAAAKNAVKQARGKLLAAKKTYNTKLSDRAQKYRELGPLLEKAGLQSGMSAKDAQNISLGVQAKPVIELALSVSEEMLGALPDMPGEDDEAARGCTLALNRDELIERYGTLKTAKRVTKIKVDKWTKRLASVNKAINAAHD